MYTGWKMLRLMGLGNILRLVIFLSFFAIDFLTDHHRSHISVKKKRKSVGGFARAIEASTFVPTRREVKTQKPKYPSDLSKCTKLEPQLKPPRFGTKIWTPRSWSSYSRMACPQVCLLTLRTRSPIQHTDKPTPTGLHTERVRRYSTLTKRHPLDCPPKHIRRYSTLTHRHPLDIQHADTPTPAGLTSHVHTTTRATHILHNILLHIQHFFFFSSLRRVCFQINAPRRQSFFTTSWVTAVNKKNNFLNGRGRPNS